MDEIYIYHHLGLGDHIICNGLVRYYVEKYDKVYVFCKNINYKNVSYMYRDQKKIVLIPLDNDYEVNSYINNKNIRNICVKIGFENLKQNRDSFDESFYEDSSVPFEFRFSKFFLERDLNKEELVYQVCNPTNEKYIFLHGKIDENKIRSDFKIIKNPEQFGIFEILKLIENAEEVHLMESSIKCLVNSFKFDKPSFFYHQYVRNGSSFYSSRGLNEFIIIN